ncbi:MAG: hypothetical protein UV05_C0026G0002 [candidate division CPR1 bacterium GW2011_GWA2_42_17]|uniref:Uncharacterized protein n=1 Tax=candidate division CPR1 bacterium GW2011_GWA2_42_17 TaxID=1618341 RepID=A0A0G1BBD4_9BACT|nr:MAG: hypothetical protein UV05_C0026G0002 [candidate division CPR1 bacterium GW2011_GWA2_42_17]
MKPEEIQRLVEELLTKLKQCNKQIETGRLILQDHGVGLLITNKGTTANDFQQFTTLVHIGIHTLWLENSDIESHKFWEMMMYEFKAFVYGFDVGLVFGQFKSELAKAK